MTTDESKYASVEPESKFLGLTDTLCVRLIASNLYRKSLFWNSRLWLYCNKRTLHVSDDAFMHFIWIIPI